MLAWAIVAGASALINLDLTGWETPDKFAVVVALFAIGGAAAFPASYFVASFLSVGRGREAAFAAMFACLMAATVGLTACLFAFVYRLYYAQWHAPAFTYIWTLELVFTAAAAIYQFAVLGVRLYFPIGFMALFAASFWFARQSR
jgi:hypothetical protein